MARQMRPATRRSAKKTPPKRPAAKRPVRKPLHTKARPRATPRSGKAAAKPAERNRVGKAPQVPLPQAAVVPAKGAALGGHKVAEKGKDGAKVEKTLEAFCPRCKVDAPHTVAVMIGEKIRRVKCAVCGTEHNFHRSLQLKARSAKTEGVAAPVAHKKKRDDHRAHGHQRVFEEQMLGRDPGLAKAYNLKDKYYQEDLIRHTLFGLGLVTKIKEDGKIEVVFKDGTRVLAHNRFVPAAKK